MQKLIVIDGSGLIYRGFYAIPPFLKSPSGALTNAVFGFTNILLGLLQTYKPDFLAVAFDRKGPTFRHREFAEYKATRVKAPQELYDQIPLVKELVRTFGIPGFEAEGFEADDVLAAIVKRMQMEKNVETLIATGDFDMFQTASEKVKMLYPAKGFKEAVLMGPNEIREKYGLAPSQIPDYKGLAGDHSDNLPGVHGIGEKGAKELLAKYGTLEGVYAHGAELKPGLQKKLAAGKESAFLCRKLATLNTEAPFDFSLEACRVKNFNAAAVRKAFAELGFKSLQKRLDEIAELSSPQGALF